MKTTINNKLGVITVALLLSGLVPSTMMAQDKVEASVGADLVSGYIWRGQNLGGVSVQPSLGISYKGLSLGAWGSVGIESKDTKEFDLTLGYSIGGFSVSITDYWFDKTYTGDVDEYGKEIYTTNKYFQYGAYSTAHVFEAQVGYDFGPLAVAESLVAEFVALACGCWNGGEDDVHATLAVECQHILCGALRHFLVGSSVLEVKH